MSYTQAKFLAKLEAEAKLQARLEKQRVLPKQLDWFTSLVGRYPVWVLLGGSFLAAILVGFG